MAKTPSRINQAAKQATAKSGMFNSPKKKAKAAPVDVAPGVIPGTAKKVKATQPVATMAPKSVPVTSVMPAPMATKANRSNVAKAKRANTATSVSMPTQAQAMQAKAMLDVPGTKANVARAEPVSPVPGTRVKATQTNRALQAKAMKDAPVREAKKAVRQNQPSPLMKALQEAAEEAKKQGKRLSPTEVDAILKSFNKPVAKPKPKAKPKAKKKMSRAKKISFGIKAMRARRKRLKQTKK